MNDKTFSSVTMCIQREFALACQKLHLYFGRVAILLLAALLAVGCNGEKKSKELQEQAQDALENRDLELAEELALKAAKADPNNGMAWLVAGDAAQSDGRFDDAIEHYRNTPSSDEDAKLAGYVRTATVLMERQGKLSEAESELNKALEDDSNLREAHDGLAFMMSISGRRWESSSHFLSLIRRLQFQPGHLIGLGLLDDTLPMIDLLEGWNKQNPDEPLTKLGLARIAIELKELDKGKALLIEVLEARPDLLEGHARLGQVLAMQNDLGGLKAWHSSLPKNADTHPDIWAARGDWRLLVGDQTGATRCFAEALKINPNLQQSAFQLVRLLYGLKQEELARVVESRARLLLNYQETLVKFRTDSENVATIVQAARIAEQLGRYWEARGWWMVAKQLDPEGANYETYIEQLNETLQNGPPQTISSMNPMNSVDLDQWPLPDWEASQSSVGTIENTQRATIQFEDVSSEVGFEFTYFNGRKESDPGPYLFQVDGGGVAAFDFDLNGRPDIWMTQGCEFPLTNPRTQHLDRLFQNVAGNQTIDVTTKAFIAERGFGQGIAVGDIDNDGFPDVLVANIGQNSLFHNLGDGTFEEISLEAGIQGEEWTASCAIADLNKDGLPDIYEVNYLKGDDIHRRTCPDENGIKRICPPIEFDAEADKVYLNRGDGTFEDASERLGIQSQSGKGLGIVIADFDQSGELGIFVANDVVQNFFWKPRFANRQLDSFDEIGLLNGLATNANGQSQACMGVAADDINGDGLLDMLVTNFHEETNCLYVQQDPGLFSDRTSKALLAEPSFLMLGFGTQFIDGDLDGRADLVVANGHLMDETDLGVPFRMRPQFFRQNASGQFDEVPSKELGEHFELPQLGRGLATFDFDGNGKEDFVVTDLEAPASIVLNRTEETGNWLSIRLIATDSARDAIGARVTVSTASQTRHRQITAGSGYQASNDTRLHFGLGAETQVESISITWPSGAEQTLDGITGNQHLTIVENQEWIQD